MKYEEIQYKEYHTAKIKWADDEQVGLILEVASQEDYIDFGDTWVKLLVDDYRGYGSPGIQQVSADMIIDISPKPFHNLPTTLQSN